MSFGSLSDWWNARQAQTPVFAQTFISRLAQDLQKMRDIGIQILIFDTPPAITATIEQVIRVCDLVVIPTRPSPHDLRAAGATEVHMCISSPPITHSCFYGIDTPERDELMASTQDLEAMRKIVGVDSLSFVSFDGLYRAVGEGKRDADNPQYCDACFSGNYPIRLTDHEAGPSPKQLSLLNSRG